MRSIVPAAATATTTTAAAAAATIVGSAIAAFSITCFSRSRNFPSKRYFRFSEKLSTSLLFYASPADADADVGSLETVFLLVPVEKNALEKSVSSVARIINVFKCSNL